MSKRILSLFLVVILVFSMAACTNKVPPATNEPDPVTNEPDSATNDNKNDEVVEQQPESQEIVKLVMAYPAFEGPPADLQMIQDAMNEISREKIGVEVELLVVDWGSYQQQMTLMLTGQEQLDIFVTIIYGYINAIKNGQLIDLEENDLLQTYGQGIIDNFGMEFLDACRADGVLYGIPNGREYAQGRGCAAVRTDLLEEIGYEFKNEGEIEHITIEQLSDIYAQIHEAHPELSVYQPVGGSMTQFSKVDVLGGNVFGVLLDNGKTLDVVNLFESDFYFDYATRMRDYYNKGYIGKDAATETTAVTELVKAGTLASYTTGGKPGIKQQETNLCGMPMTIFQTMGNYISSNFIAAWPWAIPINTVDPVAAVKYMNLLYTDPDMMNLISWGVEGEHYAMQDNGLINFPEGVDATNSGYIHSMGWMFHNQLITHVWEGNDPDLWDIIRKFNAEAEKSLAVGFAFNPANVSTELTAVQNVYSEYQKAIEFGLVDPVEGIAEMNAKMKDAGIDAIIAEKQAQLDAWAKLKGITG